MALVLAVAGGRPQVAARRDNKSAPRRSKSLRSFDILRNVGLRPQPSPVETAASFRFLRLEEPVHSPTDDTDEITFAHQTPDSTHAVCTRTPAIGPGGQTIETIDVRGEVDLANCTRLRLEIEEAIDRCHCTVVDLTNVSFIDSTGLGALVAARNHAHQLGHTLQIRLPSGQARRPFELTGLDELFSSDLRRSTSSV
jgi:anti-sigma B factor antagonist